MAITRYHLDYNELFPLDLEYDPATQTLSVALERSANPSKRFVNNFFKLINCSHELTDGTAISKTIERGKKDQVVFHPVPAEFSLIMDREPFARITTNANGTLNIHHNRQLTSDQTRMLGTHHTSKAWLSETGLDDEAYDALRNIAHSMITSDFHTHSSGQISAKGLLKVATDHEAYYPIHLLKELGIKDHFDASQKRVEKRIEFPPLEPQDLPPEVECVSLNALSPQELRTLELHMSLRTDRQASYTDAENDAYRLRYPLTKNNDLLKDTLKQMARECLANGITYAEISFVGLDKPDIFRKVHEAIWEMEQDPELSKFALRFKHGIPRTLSQNQFKDALEKAKALLDSPYIIGIDVLGYEVNKTNEFYDPLKNFAGWMSRNAPKATLCVHAGENDKNPNNVLDALELARDHNIYVRIGHGLYGLEGEALKLAKELSSGEHADDPKIHIETNPGSNIALNNINHESNMPFRRMLNDENNIPFSVNSDSLGLYQLSARQLGIALIHAGFKPEDFKKLDTHQQNLLARQHAYTQGRMDQIKGWNTPEGKMGMLEGVLGKLGQFVPSKGPTHYRASDSEVASYLESQGVELIRNPKRLPESLEGKRPITIVGAGGNGSPNNSWARISDGHKREIAIAYDMLAHAIDPDKAYIVQGRLKAEGVNEAINAAVRDVEHAGLGKFERVGILTDPTLDTHTDYSHLTHMVRIKGQLDVADEIVNYTVNHDGVLIAAGGAAYTRDIILKADYRMENRDKGLLYVMDGPAGASTEKAQDMDDSYKFGEGKGLIAKLSQQQPELFREEFRNLDEAALRKLYNEAAQRVGDRYGLPGTKQKIDDVQPAQQRDRGKS